MVHSVERRANVGDALARLHEDIFASGFLSL